MNAFDQFDTPVAKTGQGNPFDQFDAQKPQDKGYAQSITDAGGASIAKRGIGLFQTAEDIGLPVHKLFGVDKATFDKATSDATKNENQAEQGTGITGTLAGAVVDPVNFMLPSMGAAKGAGVLRSLAAGAKAGATYGAIAGGTGAITDNKSRVGEAAKGGAFGATVGAAIPAVAKTLSTSSNALGGIYNRIASLMGNEAAQGRVADNIIAKRLVAEGFNPQEVEAAIQSAKASGLMPTLGEATGSSGIQQVEKSILRGNGEGANTLRNAIFDRNKNTVPTVLKGFAGDLEAKSGDVSGKYQAAADEAAQRMEIPFTAQETARLPVANDIVQTSDNGLVNFYQNKLDELNGKFGVGDSTKKPILNWIKNSGGINTESKAAQELNSMGINSTTYPALFRKSGGIGDLDNIPLSEFNSRFGLAAKDGGNGYVDRDWLLNALKNEKFKAGTVAPVDNSFINALDEAGIDYRKATGNDVFNALHPDEAERLAIQSSAATKANPIEDVNNSIKNRLGQLGNVNNLETKALKQAQSILDNAKSRGNSFDALLDAKKQLDDLFIEGADANAQKNASRYVAQYSKQITDTLNQLAPNSYKAATQAAKTNMAAQDILEAVNSTNEGSLAALYNKVWAKPELRADFLRKLPDNATRQQATTLFENLEKIKRGFGGSDTAFNLPANKQLASEAGLGFDPQALNPLHAPQSIGERIAGAAQSGVYKQIARQSVNPDTQKLLQAMQRASGAGLMRDITPYATNAALVTGEHALENNAARALPAPQIIQNIESQPVQQPQSANDPISTAAQATGMNPQLLQLMAQRESGGNPNARAKTSTAKGLFQFTTGTWNDMVKKYGADYGITKAGIFDAGQNAMAAALFAKDNAQYLTDKIGRPPTDAEIYMAHFLGAKGAAKLLNSTGSENAVALFPQAAQANRSIFYNGMKPRTTAELYQVIANKIGA